MDRQVLCIWLPNWPCQRIAAARSQTGKSQAADLPLEPVDANRSFALQWHDPRRGLRIAAADVNARLAGVQPGMSRSEATAILPELEIIEHDPQADLHALQELTDAASQFSPLVGIELLDKHPWVGRHLNEPQAILADVTNLTHFFDGAPAMTEAIYEWLLMKGYIASVAIAPSVGAAWAAANYVHRGTVLETLAKARTSEQTTSLTCVWDENCEVHYQQLDVAALRIDESTYKTLRRLGLNSIGAIRKLPRHGLAARLGQSLLRRLDSLTGADQEAIACHHAGPEFYVETRLDVPTERRDTIEELLRRLCRELCQKLQHHGQGALRVLCRLSLVGEQTRASKLHLLQLGLYRPTSDAGHLQRLLLGQFEQLRRTLTVGAISLQASVVGALRWQQTNLFNQAEVNHGNRTAELIDVLASRLGSDAVLRPVCEANPQPELAVQWQVLTGSQVAKDQKGAAGKATAAADGAAFSAVGIEPQNDDPLRRPLQLLQPPVELDVSAVYPDGPPIRFRWSNRLDIVVRYWGPERIESGWWNGPSQRRDYYRVETESGSWLWLYRDLRSHQWFMHGEYS